jgi:hypothetical protein
MYVNSCLDKVVGQGRIKKRMEKFIYIRKKTITTSTTTTSATTTAYSNINISNYYSIQQYQHHR